MSSARLEIGQRVVVEPDHLVGFVAAILYSRDTEDMVIGLEVESVSGRQYFLPLAVAAITGRQVTVSSPLHLVDDLGFYRKHGRAQVAATVSQRRVPAPSSGPRHDRVPEGIQAATEQT